MLTFSRLIVLAAGLFACAMQAQADSANDLLMPGQLISGHAKYENECNNCHKPYDKSAQPVLCKDCHKDVSKEIAEKRAYHGLMKE